MLAKFLNKCSESIQTVLFPTDCVLCEQRTESTTSLCLDCQQTLPGIISACHQCGLPLQVSEPLRSCGHCLNRPPLYSDSIQSLWKYDGFVREWIIQAKFFRGRHYLKPLSHLLANRIRQQPINNDDTCLIPVPLHPARQRQRGFNQSLEIARYIQQQTQIPIRKNLLKKVKLTAPQASLSLKRRHANIQGAFRLEGDLTEKHCLIVDDVITSGQTIEAIAKVLKEAGAARVEAWSLARTVQKAEPKLTAPGLH